jgi:hypothetical protein
MRAKFYDEANKTIAIITTRVTRLLETHHLPSCNLLSAVQVVAKKAAIDCAQHCRIDMNNSNYRQALKSIGEAVRIGGEDWHPALDAVVSFIIDDLTEAKAAIDELENDGVLQQDDALQLKREGYFLKSAKINSSMTLSEAYDLAQIFKYENLRIDQALGFER